jgi:hypothetical protein
MLKRIGGACSPKTLVFQRKRKYQPQNQDEEMS